MEFAKMLHLHLVILVVAVRQSAREPDINIVVVGVGEKTP
jgi:hypothetical protein